MNILQAKQEIAASLAVYHRRDEDGFYVCPPERQRPILLMGPPGIGKSAVMEQIARERGIGFVSYTMTHHTRQSAIGLPRIVTKTLDGQTRDVTVYTLSEILASVYVCMEETGCREGLLFIDEINCVSETLAPVMLQFLQNKMFGSHRVPEGWMIVAAGNPPEYNRSVRPLDMVTLDRIRRIDVEPDAACWLTYADAAGVHGAVTSWIRLNPERFYKATWNEEDEPVFVTARGWEDLSTLLTGCEQTDHTVTEETVGEFLGDPRTAADFTLYYHKYARLTEAWSPEAILNDTLTEAQLRTKMQEAAALSEEMTLTFTSMILQILNTRIRHSIRETAVAKEETRLLGQWEKQAKQPQRGKQERQEKQEGPDQHGTQEQREQFGQLTSTQCAAKRLAEQSGTEKTFAGFLALQEERLSVLTEHGVITRDEADIRRRALARVKAAGAAGRIGSENPRAKADPRAQAEKYKHETDDQICRALQFVQQSFGDGPQLQMLRNALRGDPVTEAYLEGGTFSAALTGTNDSQHGHCEIKK